MPALLEMMGSLAPSAVSKEVFQSLALELMIFCVTIALAVVVKVSSRRKAKRCLATPTPSKNKLRRNDFDERQPPVVKTPATVPLSVQNNLDGTHKAAPSLVDAVIEQTSFKTGNAEKALALYTEMRSIGQHLQIKDLIRRSKRYSAADFFSALLQAAVRAERPEFAEILLDDMVIAEVERTLAFYESAMKVLSSKKHYQAALNVYNRLAAEGLKASPVTLSCLINFTTELEDFDRAIGFFEQLASTSTPSIRAYMTILRVHSKRQDWPSSLQILRSMQETKVHIDTLIMNTVLSTGVSAGKTEAAEELLHESAKTNPRIVDVISYNTILKGYAHQKTADKALRILSQLLDRGVKANGITFNTVLDAAIRCNQPEDAWKVLEQMQEAGIRPDKYTCTTLMKGLHEESTPRQLSKVLDTLQIALPHCEPALRSTLLRGIVQVAARLNNLALMMRGFSQMQRQHVLPSAQDYQTMIQALSQQGHTSDCSVVWQSVMTSVGSGGQQQTSANSVITVFAGVMEELSKREKVEAMLCSFDSLSEAIMACAPRSLKGSSSILQQCRAKLIHTASRNKDSSPAFQRLVELAHEYGMAEGATMPQ
jgi:pentatricopeptide repeat protein